MPKGPNSPPSPGGLPNDAFHQTYGNPTVSHPDVMRLKLDDFEDEAAMFVQLSNQEFIEPGSEEDPASEDEPFSVARTSLPIIRPGDLVEGVLLYSPQTTDPRTVYEVHTLPDLDETDAPREESVSLKAHTANGPLSDVTPDTLSTSTAQETRSIDELIEKFTFLRPKTTIYNESEESDAS